MLSRQPPRAAPSPAMGFAGISRTLFPAIALIALMALIALISLIALFSLPIQAIVAIIAKLAKIAIGRLRLSQAGGLHIL